MAEYKEFEPNHSPEFRKECWDVAIGLQAVDELEVPETVGYYARQHIEGFISLEETKEKLYQTYTPDVADPQRQKDASLVPVHIVELLSDTVSFNFSPVMLKHVHKTLFEGVYDHAGQFRTYNFSKEEPVLNGQSVSYADYHVIRETFSQYFNEESEQSYAGKSKDQVLRQIAKFTSDIWQVHAFCEGNTRATAVFMLLYLRNLGFRINHGVFKEHSKYFRDALVRANFADYSLGIEANLSFLIAFYDNMLFEGNHLLSPYYKKRGDFEIYKSNICHALKELGDIEFLIRELTIDDITKYWEKKWYLESLYLLAMVDYVSRVNNIPLCNKYDTLRQAKLSEMVFSRGIHTTCLITKSDKPKKDAIKQAIPEFLRHNIVEADVRNVV